MSRKAKPLSPNPANGSNTALPTKTAPTTSPSAARHFRRTPCTGTIKSSYSGLTVLCYTLNMKRVKTITAASLIAVFSLTAIFCCHAARDLSLLSFLKKDTHLCCKKNEGKSASSHENCPDCYNNKSIKAEFKDITLASLKSAVTGVASVIFQPPARIGFNYFISSVGPPQSTNPKLFVSFRQFRL